MSTYKSIRSGSSETAALDNGRRQGLGLDIWLALLVGFLSVGLSTWVWMNNDDIVAWGMSQGMVSEGSIGTLLGVVRRAAMVSAVLGAAGLMMRPMRLGVTKTVSTQARIVSAAYKWHPRRYTVFGSPSWPSSGTRLGVTKTVRHPSYWCWHGSAAPSSPGWSNVLSYESAAYKAASCSIGAAERPRGAVASLSAPSLARLRGRPAVRWAQRYRGREERGR